MGGLHYVIFLYAYPAYRNSPREASHIDRLAEHLGVWQNIKTIADPALSVVIIASDASAVTMRTKALRALGQIVTSDPQILRNVSSPCLLPELKVKFGKAKSTSCDRTPLAGQLASSARCGD